MGWPCDSVSSETLRKATESVLSVVAPFLAAEIGKCRNGTPHATRGDDDHDNGGGGGGDAGRDGGCRQWGAECKDAGYGGNKRKRKERTK